MEKFIKIIAVILLIGGIIGSLVNIEYALTGIFTSVAAFTLLYGFGMILGSVQRMEQCKCIGNPAKYILRDARTFQS